MKYYIRCLREAPFARYCKIGALIIVIIVAGCFASTASGSEFKPNIYVPYEDLAQLIEPVDKAVLMDRAEFEKLLTAAETRTRESDTLELGQVKKAEYSGEISGENLTLTGKLEVVSMSKGPVAVPLGFAQIGLTRVVLDGRPAPLGYDKKGKLTLIVTAKGRHELEIEGATKLKELSSGGMQFSIFLPEAVAAKMKLSAAGDLEMHSTAPASQTSYNKETDRTNIELTLGGQNKLTVILLGNGRQEDDRSILLGESATTVSLTRSHQVLSCLYTVQILRRGLRELRFRLPSEWTITEVTCPSLVRWSVNEAQEPQDLKTLTVRLRSGKVGTVTLHIKASTVRRGETWHSPPVTLTSAAYERGYLLVNTDEGIGVRGEKLIGARREDVSAMVSVTGLVSGTPGRLYFYWGDKWSVELELAVVELRRSIKERQKVVVSPEQVTLTGDFEVTAVERELFDMAFALGGLARQWQIKTVQVDKKDTGFEYRIEDKPGRRLLKIELSRPIRPEKIANVSIVLQHVPSDWHWPSDATKRSISVPLIESQAETVSGYVTISALGDLDALPKKTPDGLEAVPIGRMASLGMTGEVQYAYSYNVATKAAIGLQVSRRRPRISGEAIGIISVSPRDFTGHWRITYIISRASAKRLYLLADKSLGQEIKITSAAVPISSKSIVTPNEKTLPLPDKLAQQYNLWLLNLDHKAIGDVAIGIHYERPLVEKSFQVPLVRPICEGQISEQLAVQASEELALTVNAGGAKEIDAVDLPFLPIQARRVLAAFRLDAVNTVTGPEAAVMLETAIHKNYEIPSALVVSAELTTYLDVQGWQRTEASFRIANAGKQFLTVRLPKGAELWSLRVDDRQAKPQHDAQGDYQVALGQLGKPVAVRVVYAYKPTGANLERVKLGGVELPGVEMNQMSWNVLPPPGYHVTSQETKMQTHDIVRPTPVYLQTYNFLTENLFAGSLVLPSLGRMRAADKSVSFAALSEKERIGVVAGRELRERGTRAGVKLAPPPPPSPVTKPAKPKGEVQQAFGVRLTGKGRFTLPVDLVPTVGGGPRARFAGLGTTELIVGLTKRSWEASWWAVGFVLIVTIGMAIAKQKVRIKAMLIIAVLLVSSLLSIWWPVTTRFANGVFIAGICLVPLYVLICVIRWLWGKLHLTGAVSPGSVMIVTLLMSVLSLGCSVQAAWASRSGQAETGSAGQQKSFLQQGNKIVTQQEDKTALPPIIVPYEGDPTAAEQSDKILIPYSRFVKLWNQAHPEDPIDGLRPGTDISLAAVRYRMTVKGKQLNLLLTAEVKTYGKDWVVLGLPISGLAVTEATLDGKAAQLHARPKGTVLTLPGGTSGQLQLRAVVKPKYLGRRGSVSFSLPPLPGAVMDVVLPEEDLELEIDEIEGTLTKRKVNGTVVWTVGLGMTRKLTLRWLPKLGDGAADRTLSANSRHDVYAFHWAMVAVTKITYSFSGGEHDRFVLLTPEGTTLTDLKGTNVRDYREVGEKIIEGRAFKTIEVRLHRAAKKQYELMVRWLGELPTPDEPTQLLLVRAGDVSRESGTVTLHAAGGMMVKIVQVSGGRRTSIAVSKARDVELAADRAKAVAKYYWPYRPFELFVQLSRLTVTPKVNLDQLVRISTDQVELLVQASLKAERGKLFGASFILPEGYELLSAVGPAVENFYERSNIKGKFVHIKFHRGEREAKIAFVLVRKQIRLEDFQVPTVTYIDSVGHAVAEQQGRIAVQVAASLEAETVASENIKGIVPQTLKDWLDAGQINSVQFAYRYEVPKLLLRLNIRRLPTRIRVETFVGLVVRPTVAVYTYRLRYNISGSPIDHLSFRLPSEYAPLVAAESPALRNVTQSDTGDGYTRWSVALVNEVTGLVDVAVNFALPIDASTKVLKIPRVETEAPAGYRAIVAVQNMSRHDISIKDRTYFAELAVSEQQKLMPKEMRESLQYVFQSFEENWLLSLDFTPAKMAARIQAVVDLLALTTVIDREGRCRYEVKVELQNRSEQFLRVKVPKGLRLWSAKVAGQPVKPVISADSTEGQVLIPLVKTSPGGLPYDVYLYFADEAAKPLVEPLNGITRLKPPGVSIVGIPVMRTTWSLQLPSGYRYLRPGGNMSPVAGTVEMLNLGIEARLEQLKRLEKTYRDVAGLSIHREQMAQRNWELFNKKLAEEISQAQSFLKGNRNQVSKEDYRRLSSRLGGQKRMQDVIVGGNVAFIQKQDELARNDINTFLNYSISNAGVAEIVRNNALLEKPGFLSESERQQIARLRKELEVSEKQLKVLQKYDAYDDLMLKETIEDEATREELIRAKGRAAKELIAEGAEKDAEVGEILRKVTRETAAQIDRKQAQIVSQLEEFQQSRSQRHFQEQRGRAQALRPQSSLKQPQAVTGMPDSRPEAKQALDEPVQPILGDVPSLAPQEMQPYVAKGIYSLPVTLPEGEVRLDFARPSGEAELSIWVVSVSTIRKLYGTLAVMVALILVLGIIKVWPKPETRRPISVKRIIVYIALLVVLTVILGLIGLLVSLFIILLSESRRGAFAPLPIRKTGN